MLKVEVADFLLQDACVCRWLVSLSYRVTFRRDPIPSESMQTASHKLKHVPGAIYMSEAAMQPGPQPQEHVKNLSMGDHTAEAYAQALDATCQKTLDREQNTGVNKFHPHTFVSVTICAQQCAHLQLCRPSTCSRGSFLPDAVMALAMPQYVA